MMPTIIATVMIDLKILKSTTSKLKINPISATKIITPNIIFWKVVMLITPLYIILHL